MLTIRSSTARMSAIMRNIRIYRSLSTGRRSRGEAVSSGGEAVSSRAEAALGDLSPRRGTLFCVAGMAQFLSAIRGSAVQRQFRERPAQVVDREDPRFRVRHAELLEHPVEVRV